MHLNWLNRYVKSCPGDMVTKLFCKSLNKAYNVENRELLYVKIADTVFPELKRLEVSPSGRRGI